MAGRQIPCIHVKIRASKFVSRRNLRRVILRIHVTIGPLPSPSNRGPIHNSRNGKERKAQDARPNAHRIASAAAIPERFETLSSHRRCRLPSRNCRRDPPGAWNPLGLLDDDERDPRKQGFNKPKLHLPSPSTCGASPFVSQSASIAPLSALTGRVCYFSHAHNMPRDGDQYCGQE